jgi:hypothetical protein
MAPSKELRGGGQKLQAETAPSRWRAHVCCSPPCWSSPPLYVAADVVVLMEARPAPDAARHEDVRLGEMHSDHRGFPRRRSRTAAIQSASRTPERSVARYRRSGELPGLTLRQLERGLPSRSDRAGRSSYELARRAVIMRRGGA